MTNAKNTNEQQAPGYYRLAIGDIEVICVSDGTLSTDFNAAIGTPAGECEKIFEENFFFGEPRNSTNVYIVRSAGRTALIDTGSGPHIDYPNPGKLFENAAAAGVAVDDIDTILFTHIHPDHCSGLLDKDFKKVFPNAKLKMARSEYLFWLSDNPHSKQIAHVAHEADHVIKFVGPYRDQIETFIDGEVFPGVIAVPLPGHTPGHTGFRIGSGTDDILVWGDIVHWPLVQFDKPETAMTYDVDPKLAEKTRLEIFNIAADTGQLVAGMHLFFPGLTRVRREGPAFAMVPYPWGHSDAITNGKEPELGN